MDAREKRLERMREKVRPKSYFEELAEGGFLMDYINEFLKEKFETDEEFRDEMLWILFKYSNTVVPEIELMYLQFLNMIMNNFTTKVKSEYMV